MGSNEEWHSWQPPARKYSERRSYHQPHGAQAGAPRPHVQEDTLKEMFIQIERKVFAIALKENVRGRFLRITEEANDKFTTIIIPATGLEDLLTVIIEMVRVSKDNPPPDEPPAPTAGPA